MKKILMTIVTCLSIYAADAQQLRINFSPGLNGSWTLSPAATYSVILYAYDAACGFVGETTPITVTSSTPTPFYSSAYFGLPSSWTSGTVPAPGYTFYEAKIYDCAGSISAGTPPGCASGLTGGVDLGIAPCSANPTTNCYGASVCCPTFPLVHSASLTVAAPSTAIVDISY